MIILYLPYSADAEANNNQTKYNINASDDNNTYTYSFKFGVGVLIGNNIPYYNNTGGFPDGNVNQDVATNGDDE